MDVQTKECGHMVHVGMRFDKIRESLTKFFIHILFKETVYLIHDEKLDQAHHRFAIVGCPRLLMFD